MVSSLLGKRPSSPERAKAALLASIVIPTIGMLCSVFRHGALGLRGAV